MSRAVGHVTTPLAQLGAEVGMTPLQTSQTLDALARAGLVRVNGDGSVDLLLLNRRERRRIEREARRGVAQ